MITGPIDILLWVENGVPSLVIIDGDGERFIFKTREEIFCQFLGTLQNRREEIIKECELQLKIAEKSLKGEVRREGCFSSFKELVGFLKEPKINGCPMIY